MEKVFGVNWIMNLRKGQDQIVVFVLVLLFINLLELYGWQVLGEALHQGFYFQPWPSNFMMQTLNIENLRQAPLESLFYLHTQPPMLDSIRAVLAQFSPSDSGKDLELFVDRGLYFAWTVVFTLLAVIIYTWTKLALASKGLATMATLIWVLHPAPLAMATLLEGTLLSTLFITWLLFSLWCLAENRNYALLWASLAFILCFATRTVFQWYSLLILAGALVLIRVPVKKMLLTLVLISMPVSALVIKQVVLFDTTSTTTFAGEHKLGLIWYSPTEDEIKKVRSTIHYTYPAGAGRLAEYWNSEKQAVKNLIYTKIFEERVRCCLPEIFPAVVRSLSQNISNFWLPTSSFRPNAFLTLVFWRQIYDSVFSKWFVLTCLATAGFWLIRNLPRRQSAWPYFGSALMGLYVTVIILLANRYEWVEALRLKMFIEPTGFVFLFVQFVLLLRYLYAKFSPLDLPTFIERWLKLTISK